MKSILLATAFVLGFTAPAFSASSSEEDAVGYGGAKIQMMPMMIPYRVSNSVRYHVLTLRMVLAPNPETERPACFMIPILHEKILLSLYDAKLQQADFTGQRLDVLREKILQVAIANTDKSYFTGVEFLDDQSMLPPSGDIKTATSLDPRSATLSSQCK